jgi:hypothetical protein
VPFSIRDVGGFGYDEFACAGNTSCCPKLRVFRKKVLYAVENVQGDALCGGGIMLGDVRAQGEEVVDGFGRPYERHTPRGVGRSLVVSQDRTQFLTRSWGMPLPRSSEERAAVMPEICHSFVSRYAAIASAARNERERPVLLASFWSLLFVERSTRTENVSVFICVQYITTGIFAAEFVFSVAAIQRSEQARLAIALRGIVLASWPVIFAQSEQGRLLRGGRGLGATKRHQVAPQIAAAVDVDEAGQCHGGTRGRQQFHERPIEGTDAKLR